MRARGGGKRLAIIRGLRNDHSKTTAYESKLNLMLELNPEDSFVYQVFSAAHAFENSLNDELSPIGITIRQVQILGVLAIHGSAAQSELADIMRIEPSSVVRLVDRMERDGWVSRSEDPMDRRRRIVRPTAKCRPIWERIRKQGGHVKDQALQNISPEDIEATCRTLAAIRTNLMGEHPNNSSGPAACPLRA